MDNCRGYGGWLPDAILSRCGRIALSHNFYVSSHSGPGLVRRNIFCRGALQGCMLRSGGVVDDNLFVDCGVAGVVGVVQSEWTDNVCLGGADLSADPDDARGYGPEGRICAGVTFSGNIVASKSVGVGGGPGFNLDYRNTSPWIAGEAPLKLPQNPRLVLTGNIIYDWDGGLRVKMYDGTLTASGNVFCNFNASNPLNLDYTTATLALSGNKYYSTASAGQEMKLNGSLMSFDTWRERTGDTSVFEEQEYDDPTVSVESYNVSIGGTADLDDFMDAAKAQWRENWDSDLQATAVNAYVRTGFTPA